MPIYEYKCQDCEADFEEIVSVNAEKNPHCPSCNSARTEKKLSIFGSIGSTKRGGSSCGTSKFS